MICRQEGGAAFMAESYAKLTGKTRHLPGHPRTRRHQRGNRRAHGVSGFIADDHCWSGKWVTISSSARAFQELDYRRMFGPMAKWVAQIDDAARVPEYMAHAFQIATSGRPVLLRWRCRRTCSPRPRASPRRGHIAPIPSHPGAPMCACARAAGGRAAVRDRRRLWLVARSCKAIARVR